MNFYLSCVVRTDIDRSHCLSIDLVLIDTVCAGDFVIRFDLIFCSKLIGCQSESTRHSRPFVSVLYEIKRKERRSF